MKKMQSNLNKNILVLRLLSNSKTLNSYKFYKKLDKSIKSTIGHKLFTLTVVDKSKKFVERVYSSNEKIYPLLGTKPIPKNEWTKRVIIKKKEFLGSNFNQIKKLFFDYEVIQSIGCGSIINLPILHNNKILGTLNVLHKENYYTKDSVKSIIPFSQLLSSYFLIHQIEMKK